MINLLTCMMENPFCDSLGTMQWPIRGQASRLLMLRNDAVSISLDETGLEMSKYELVIN